MKTRDPIAYQLRSRQFHQRIVRETKRTRLEELERKEAQREQDTQDECTGC